MLPTDPDTPLAGAELAIERAAIAALRRQHMPRTLRAWLRAHELIAEAAAGRPPATAPQVDVGIELARLAGLMAVRAAAADEDMHALRVEVAAALDALNAA